MIAEPSIQDLIEFGGKAIKGLDGTTDLLRGSDYEALIGPSAVIWSRQARRDTDLFRATKFNSAVGADLTELARRRYGKERRLESFGKGTLAISRSASGSQETVWEGTRVSLRGDISRSYRVTETVVIASGDTVATLPIEATQAGTGVAIHASLPNIRFEDPLQDTTWVARSINVVDGTAFEDAAEFRARIRRERFAERVGQADAITAACMEAGAEKVVLFRSDYAGDAYDYGLNVCYVGTLGHTSTPELVKACALRLRSCRVAGDHMQVLQMTNAELDVSAKVYLFDSPAKFNLSRLEYAHHTSIRSYVGEAGRYTYAIDGLYGAIGRLTPEVQRVEILTPLADGSIVEGSLKNFPQSLTKYTVGKISLQYLQA